MPKLGKHEAFEQKYRKKFEVLAEPYGIFVNYERDRAALDLGVHLTSPTDEGHRQVTDRRVWFQLKGKESDTLPEEVLGGLDAIPLDLVLDDVRLWYGSPEVVYLVVYVESVDSFYAEDIRDIVDRRRGAFIYSPESLDSGQKTGRFHILRDARLDDSRWLEMARHRSMRIDGPLFRGRPLGHRLDPLRCTLKQMAPAAFSAMIRRLLEVHRFEVKECLDFTRIFPNSESGDGGELLLGQMFHMFEWTCQLFTEMSFDAESDFRIEGQPFHVQGPCAVLIHSERCGFPDADGLRWLAAQLHSQDMTELLVFANERVPPRYLGSFRGVLGELGVSCLPQGLSDIPYNLLTATAVYLEFVEKVDWDFVQYLR